MASAESPDHTLPGVQTRIGNGLTTTDSELAEKTLHSDRQSHNEHEKENLETPPVVSDEYPTGSRLVPILASVIFAVFMVSLDMVSRSSFSSLATRH